MRHASTDVAAYLRRMLLYLATTVLVTTLFTETAARKAWLPYWVARKILHLIAVGACAIATMQVDRAILIWVVAASEIILFGLILSNQLMREESGRRAWGIIWFPMAFLLMLLFVPDDHIVAFAMLTLAICDPAATVSGKLFSRTTYQLTGDNKSLIGNLFFLLAFWLLVWIHLPFNVSLGWGNLIGLGLILTVAEALGSRGLDNLTIPLLASFILLRLSQLPSTPNLLLYFVPIALVGGGVLVWRKSLTPGGAFTAGLLALVIALSTASVSWLFPLLFFLLSSSLIGKILPARTVASDAKQQKPRDATQVMANGGYYGFIAMSLASGYPDFFGPSVEVCLLTAAAIATADTWSSEIGQYFQRPTYDLIKWQSVPPGLSGGVSWPGTLAGFGGAFFLVLASSWLLPTLSFPQLMMIVFVGFLGMLIDSMLGSLGQAKYQASDGTLSDTTGDNSLLVGGFNWMTNDLVNFLAIVLGVGLIQLLDYLL